MSLQACYCSVTSQKHKQFLFTSLQALQLKFPGAPSCIEPLKLCVSPAASPSQSTLSAEVYSLGVLSAVGQTSLLIQHGHQPSVRVGQFSHLGRVVVLNCLYSLYSGYSLGSLYRMEVEQKCTIHTHVHQ